MFSLEIDFHDGISPPETILVRRSNAIVGSSDLAHVVVDGAASSQCELRLVRGLGREFSCFPVRRPGHATSPPPFLEGSYSGDTEVKLGDLTFHVTALDIDLMLTPDEFPDKATTRILRAALTGASPMFPAVAVLGTKPIFLSFPPSQVLLVGRSRRCGLRLDSPDVSSDHARIGIEHNQAWVEDLGSTNGTLVNGERISGRRYLEPTDRIGIGAEFVLLPVLGVEGLSLVSSQTHDVYEASEISMFPSLVASGAEVRPTRRVLKEGESITIGRDPACDIWINAAHISRNHVLIERSSTGIIAVTDLSSNGTFLNEQRLERSQRVVVATEFLTLDLSEGVLVGLCYSERDEERFFGKPEQNAPESVASESLDLSNREKPADRDNNYVTLAEQNPLETVGAFQRFAEKQRKQAYATDLYASEYEESEDSEESYSAGVERTREGSRASRNPYSDFAAGISANQAELELDLLSPEEIDEELLRTPYFQGVSRGLLALLLVIVVLFVLLLFISIFRG